MIGKLYNLTKGINQNSWLLAKEESQNILMVNHNS